MRKIVPQNTGTVTIYDCDYRRGMDLLTPLHHITRNYKELQRHK
jgi:hypothetical protein